MHKDILIGLCVLCISTTTSAADLEYKWGFSFTNQRGPGVINDSKPQIGGIYGLGLALRVTKSFTLQPELLYVKKGLRYNGEEESLTFRYLSVPLLARYCFETKSSMWSLYAGPDFSYALSARVGESLKKSHKLSDDEFNRFDSGVAFGGSAAISATGSNYLFIDLRYTLGLLSTSPDSNAQTKNGAFSLMFGFGITDFF